ncbi:uncharacterized protein FN964_015831 [Alca torda]
MAEHLPANGKWKAGRHRGVTAVPGGTAPALAKPAPPRCGHLRNGDSEGGLAGNTCGRSQWQSAPLPPIANRRQSPPRAEEPISARRVPGAGEGGRPSRRRVPAGHDRSQTAAGGRRRRRAPVGCATEEGTQPGAGPEPCTWQCRRLVSPYYVIKARIKSIPFQFPAGLRPGGAAPRGAGGRRFRPVLTARSRSPRRAHSAVAASCSPARWKAGRAPANRDSHSRPAPRGGSDVRGHLSHGGPAAGRELSVSVHSGSCSPGVWRHRPGRAGRPAGRPPAFAGTGSPRAAVEGRGRAGSPGGGQEDWRGERRWPAASAVAAPGGAVLVVAGGGRRGQDMIKIRISEEICTH